MILDVIKSADFWGAQFRHWCRVWRRGIIPLYHFHGQCHLSVNLLLCALNNMKRTVLSGCFHHEKVCAPRISLAGLRLINCWRSHRPHTCRHRPSLPEFQNISATCLRKYVVNGSPRPQWHSHSHLPVTLGEVDIKIFLWGGGGI
jgi:hypothetical protein